MKNKKHLIMGVIFLLLSLSFFMLAFFVIEPDYLWHIKAGEVMFHKGVLRHDVFSWYVRGKPWMSHEWLFEYIIYGLKCLFGKMHVFIYCFTNTLCLLLLLFIPNIKEKIKNIPYFLSYFIFFFFLFAGFIQVRPHLLSFLLLAGVIYSLYDLYHNEFSKKIYLVPLFTIIWANVHGGSSNLGYLLCFIFYIIGHFSFEFRKIESKRLSRRQLKKYLLVGIISMICVCINVHGLLMFIYPYQNMMDTTMINNISEWQGTNLSHWNHYVYYLFVLFVLMTMIFSRKKINFIDFMVFVFFTYLGIKSIRFWPFIYISMSYVVFYYVKERKYDPGSLFIILFMSLIFIFMGISKINFNYHNYVYLDSKDIAKIREVKPKRLFNIYDFGGELVYHNIDVFIDGRADLYGKYNYLDYLSITNLNMNTDDLLKRYDFDYLLVYKTCPLNTYLNKDNNYTEVYNNRDIVMYKKIVN